MIMLAISLFYYALKLVEDQELEDDDFRYNSSHPRWWLVLASLILVGFFSLRRFTLTYRHAIKLTPHFGEGISMGLINMLANFLGAAQVIIFAKLKIW